VRRRDRGGGERDAPAVEGRREERGGAERDPRPERLQTLERRRDRRRAPGERERAGEQREREHERDEPAGERHGAGWSGASVTRSRQPVTRAMPLE
jgi:hypothetical protein